jgi:hypothetical protein
MGSWYNLGLHGRVLAFCHKSPVLILKSWIPGTVLIFWYNLVLVARSWIHEIDLDVWYMPGFRYSPGLLIQSWTPGTVLALLEQSLTSDPVLDFWSSPGLLIQSWTSDLVLYFWSSPVLLIQPWTSDPVLDFSQSWTSAPTEFWTPGRVLDSRESPGLPTQP